MERSRATAIGGNEKPVSSHSCSNCAKATDLRRLPTPATLMPRNTFSKTVRAGTEVSSWVAISTPAAAAIRGVALRKGFPHTTTLPRSGRTIPAATRISVDLPAPFSPTRAWTSPGLRLRLTSFRTSVVPYFLLMPSSSSNRPPPDNGPSPCLCCGPMPRRRRRSPSGYHDFYWRQRGQGMVQRH